MESKLVFGRLALVPAFGCQYGVVVGLIGCEGLGGVGGRGVVAVGGGAFVQLCLELIEFAASNL